MSACVREHTARYPLVDYRGFRLSRLTDPRFSHLLLLSGWLVYFLLYFLTENFIPESHLHLVHCRLDDLVPFCEPFVLAYVSWFALIVISLLWYLRHDVQRFKDMQVFIMITQGLAMLVYILWPSVQDLRPDPFPRENIFTWMLSVIYAFDTPTGVCPSLHVAYSLGILSVWAKDERAPKGWKAALCVWVLLIVLSIMFIKQHSAIDILCALPVSLVAEICVYGKRWWLPRLKGRE